MLRGKAPITSIEFFDIAKSEMSGYNHVGPRVYEFLWSVQEYINDAGPRGECSFYRAVMAMRAIAEIVK